MKIPIHHRQYLTYRHHIQITTMTHQSWNESNNVEHKQGNRTVILQWMCCASSHLMFLKWVYTYPNEPVASIEWTNCYVIMVTRTVFKCNPGALRVHVYTSYVVVNTNIRLSLIGKKGNALYMLWYIESWKTHICFDIFPFISHYKINTFSFHFNILQSVYYSRTHNENRFVREYRALNHHTVFP